MFYANAMDCDVAALSDRDLFEAVRAIGSFKLHLRQQYGVDRVIGTLRECNARIDQVYSEEARRDRERRYRN